MEKYIEAIIEIVLDNVSCEHEKPDPTYPGRMIAHATYSLDNEDEVIKKCLKLKPDSINKEEFIEKRARAMHTEIYGSLVKCDYQCNAMARFRIQVRKTLEEA